MDTYGIKIKPVIYICTYTSQSYVQKYAAPTFFMFQLNSLHTTAMNSKRNLKASTYEYIHIYICWLEPPPNRHRVICKLCDFDPFIDIHLGIFSVINMYVKKLLVYLCMTSFAHAGDGW